MEMKPPSAWSLNNQVPNMKIDRLKLILRNMWTFVWICEIIDIFVGRCKRMYFMTATFFQLIYLFMFKNFKLLLFLIILLFFTSDFIFSSPPNLLPNTFSPAIGFNKKGLTLGSTKDGFTNMTPVFYTPKQPEVKVNGTDSLHLTDSKYVIKKTVPPLDLMKYSSLNIGFDCAGRIKPV